MAENPFISICIPAFQRANYLKRLLDSIEIQSFRVFEVVITDDSPGMEVSDLIEIHALRPMIRYFKNVKTLGSPENWNEGIRRSGGDWVKIMHDDDWFAGPDSLLFFADAIRKSTALFYFSAYTNVFPDGHIKKIKSNDSQRRALNKRPEILLSSNRIGPPSAVIFKKDMFLLFDIRMHWLVDIDFYLRYLNKYPPAEYIPHNSVMIGISTSQVTYRSFGKPDIEIPERFMLSEKTDPSSIRNITVYDSWWRFIRNMKIRDEKEIGGEGYDAQIQEDIRSMIRFQKKIPHPLLQIGFLSKLFMGVHYLKMTRKKR